MNNNVCHAIKKPNGDLVALGAHEGWFDAAQMATEDVHSELEGTHFIVADSTNKEYAIRHGYTIVKATMLELTDEP